MNNKRTFILASFIVSAASLSFTQVTALAQDSAQVSPKSLLAPPKAIPIASLSKNLDSVTATPGYDYSAWFLKRLFFGDLRRDVWDIPIRVPVAKLDSIGGGLEVLELSGGKQTLGIQFKGKDGATYQFRSLVKEPRRPMPKFIHHLPPGTVSKDQMAAQFPLAPIVVTELVSAVGVLVAKPTLVIMPNDERLGKYREAFAGLMGWIEVRPEESETEGPGFAGSSKVSGTYDLYEELIKHPGDYIDAAALLRARLVDILVGDWDRHSDQWRWARFNDGNRMRWEPIPRDRDWAMSKMDGLLLPLIEFYYPQYVGFKGDKLDMDRLAYTSQRVDRTLLSSLDHDQFMDIARKVTETLTDDAIKRSVDLLPPPYADEGRKLYYELRSRRDLLMKAAEDFYAMLAREASVVATAEADSVIISASDGKMRVQLREAAPNGILRYDRLFDPRETHEVRLFLLDGKDRIVVEGNESLPVKVRIATGGGDDVVVDKTNGNNVYIYNSDGDDETDLGPRGFRTDHDYLIQDSLRTSQRVWKERDWGSQWMLWPSGDLEKDVGVLVGAKLTRSGYGFGQQPCTSCLSLEGLVAPQILEWSGELIYDKMFSSGGLWWANSVEYQSGRPTRFYGFGNEIEPARNEGQFTGYRKMTDYRTALRYEPSATWHIDAGLSMRSWGNIREGGEILETIGYGSGEFQQIGLRTALEVDSRDSKHLPHHGLVARISADYHPELLDVNSAYSSTRGVLRWYGATKLPFQPALHVRLIGEKVWGTAPYQDVPYLGGSSTLPGFSRSQFRGDAMVSANALLRARAFALGKLDVGIHGITGTGRVWLDGEESTEWHNSNGFGAWFHFQSIDKTVSVTFANGDRQRIYLDFGFIF